MVNRLTLPLADWVATTSLTQANDAQLLHRFCHLGEQQAFTTLVKRHGPMVWGVIRRLLRNHQDAEDAFQAAFLVLARKAHALRSPQLLAAWLHGVAHRTALQLRSRRKLTVPLTHDDEPADEPFDDLAWRECGQRIDHAIEQLPMRLRIIFLLCQVEGLTTLAAAKRLGLPEGTVVSRLHYARKQLQALLARHGITSAAGAVAVAWSLALPESLSALTIRSLLISTPPALVAGLAQGVLTTMMWIKFSTAAVIVSTLGLVGAGSAALIAQGPGNNAASQAGVVQQSSNKKSNQDDRIKQLENQLLEAREREAAMRQQLEALEQKNKAVQQFLEKSLLAERDQRDRANQNAAVAQDDMRARMQAERKRMIDEQAHARERKSVDLSKARELLTHEIDQLQNEFNALETQHVKLMADQQQVDIRLSSMKQDLEKEFRLAEQRYGPEHDKLKELKAKRDAILAEAGKQNTGLPQARTNEMARNRLQSQLKLREKLLLEVEEKLLRAQLGLDN